MPAYLIVQIDIHDSTSYDLYKALVPETIAKFGGRYLVRGGNVEALEGGWTPKRVAVVEFESMERAKAWHDSVEYAPARAIRHAAAHTVMLLADGVPAPAAPGATR